MTSYNLPSRDDYIANNVTVIDSCNICFESFNAEHIPARLSGNNSCHHVFGSTCLKKWLVSGNDNQNKYPTCRRELYQLPEADDEYEPDNYRPNDQGDLVQNAHTVMSITPYQPDQQHSRSSYVCANIWDLSCSLIASNIVCCIVNRCFTPGQNTYDDAHIRSCVLSAIKDLAHARDELIVVDEDDWPVVIDAVKTILRESTVTGRRPSDDRCLEIMAWEMQWQDIYHRTNPLVPSSGFDGPDTVGPLTIHHPFCPETQSITAIRHYWLAERMMHYIMDSVEPNTAYNDIQIQTRFQVVLLDIKQRHGVTVIIENDLWSSVIEIVSELLIVWSATGIRPSGLWCVRKMVRRFSLVLDEDYSRLALEAEATFGLSAAESMLVLDRGARRTSIAKSAAETGDEQVLIDIRHISDRAFGLRLLQTLFNFLYRQTGDRGEPSPDREVLCQMVTLLLTEELKISTPTTVATGFWNLVVKFRRHLSKDTSFIVNHMDYWMNEVTEIVRWQCKLTTEEQNARPPTIDQGWGGRLCFCGQFHQLP